MIKKNLEKFGEQLIIGNKAFLFAIILAVFLSFATPYFLTKINILSLVEQIVVMTVVAMGYTILLGAGEIDLSIEGLIPLAGVILAKLIVKAGWPIFAAILVCIVISALCGCVNATIITTFDLPPFIVTLATRALFTGLVYIITNLVPVSGLPAEFLKISRGRLGGVPYPVLIMIPIVIIFYLFTRHSTFVLHVLAFGGNKEAVRVAGISIRMLRMIVYALVGVCCAIASILLTARSASAQIGAGSNLMMLVIAAVVIGGTPLDGGKINIIGTVFGCLVIGMINNGMNLMGIDSNYQVIAQGLLILFALIVDKKTGDLAARINKKHELEKMEA